MICVDTFDVFSGDPPGLSFQRAFGWDLFIFLDASQKHADMTSINQSRECQRTVWWYA